MPNVAIAAVVARLALVLAVLSCRGDSLEPGGTVASVVVTPSRVSVGVGASSPLTVEVRDAGGKVLAGRKVVWASKDPAIATVSSSGIVLGVSPGNVQVAATAEGKSALVDVTVNPKAVATIRLTPSGDQELLVGQTRQMTAQPLDADGNPLSGRPVTWSTSSATVASVSAAGVIAGVAAGSAVITAASEGKSAAVAVTVSSVPIATIAVTPAADTVAVSQTLQLTATPKDAQDGVLTGRAVTWSSSDASKATVSSTGLVTGVSPGAVTITASSEGKTGASSITVKPKPVGAVILSPTQVSVELGSTRQLTAQVTDDQGNVLSGRPITFSSNNTSVATVSSTGLITAVAIGAATITATSEGKTGTADVTVTPVPVASVDVSPSTASFTIGQSGQFVAIAKDAKGSVLTGRPVSWTSGAPSVATVSNTGVVTAVGAGSAVVFATIEGKIGSATVTVRQVAVTSVTVAPSSSVVALTASVQLVASVFSGATVLTDRVVGWTSSNDAVALVSSTGRVTGLKAGTVSITATSEGVSGTAMVAVGVTGIVVSPSPTSVFVGQTRQLTAAFNNGIAGIFQWSSANTQIATVDATGLVTGRGVGTVNISASFGPLSGSSSVTVSLVPVATVTVTPPAPTVNAGLGVQLTATLKDAQGNTLSGRTITWEASNGFATISPATGSVVTVTTSTTGKGKTVVITARSEGKFGTSTVTIQ